MLERRALPPLLGRDAASGEGAGVSSDLIHLGCEGIVLKIAEPESVAFVPLSNMSYRCELWQNQVAHRSR